MPKLTQKQRKEKIAKKGLDYIVGYGVVKDIFKAETAIFLCWRIGDYADAINESNFGELFSTFQRLLINELALSLSRIFENPQKQYPTKSIPSAVAFLKMNRNRLILKNRSLVERDLANLGYSLRELSRMNDLQCTDLIVEKFETLPPKLNLGLEAWKALRDKKIGHNEAISSSSLPITRWDQAHNLLIWAKEFISLIGEGYTGLGYKPDNGEFFLTNDARRTSVALERLFQKSKLSKNSNPNPTL